MKTILVPVEQHGLMHAVLETSLKVARRFDAYVEGFAIGPDLPVAVAVDMVVGMPTLYDPALRRDMSNNARQAFETFYRANGVVPGPSHQPEPSFAFVDGDLKSDNHLGRHGRVFDLIVVGRPGSEANQPRLATAEAALFEAGRPVLIAPPAAPATVGDVVVIAWNGSTETTRAVALGMPLLAKARRIVVLTVEGWYVDGPGASQLARNLQLDGLPAETMSAPNPGGRPGETILSVARSIGSDLLIKGAYTQSRLRQMIFGGATSHILSNTTLPVLMAH
jgi:nucleotide-binding universal stress UspA family protein